ncbi:MAG: DUF134 domain-containing protein [Bacteroidales bacterium]|jgi:predicted DNA-binding protein (UPF0251 family)|nr:DUF134 domain-containing protein [Bacteroidales bacterium]
MSPRTKTLRKVLNPPGIKGYKPYGPGVTGEPAEPINLHYEEYEALRLCDYDRHNHHQASVVMGVSRPTFTRIYASALQKIARAFVEGRSISIEGGKVYFDSDWYSCSSCHCFFNNPEREMKVFQCSLCGSEDINAYDVQQDEVLTTDLPCHRKMRRHRGGQRKNTER